jgi:hypothetical protein
MNEQRRARSANVLPIDDDNGVGLDFERDDVLARFGRSTIDLALKAPPLALQPADR